MGFLDGFLFWLGKIVAEIVWTMIVVIAFLCIAAFIVWNSDKKRL